MLWGLISEAQVLKARHRGENPSLLTEKPRIRGSLRSWVTAPGVRLLVRFMFQSLLPSWLWVFLVHSKCRSCLASLFSPAPTKDIFPYVPDAFELWCWRRLLRVPWTTRRSNQSILKISPACSLEGMMLKLKLQYLGHLMQRVGRDWGQEEKGTIEDEMDGWHHQLDGHGFGWTLGVGEWQGGLACCDSWGGGESDSTEQLNWLTDSLMWIVETFGAENGVFS